MGKQLNKESSETKKILQNLLPFFILENCIQNIDIIRIVILEKCLQNIDIIPIVCLRERYAVKVYVFVQTTLYLLSSIGIVRDRWLRL